MTIDDLLDMFYQMLKDIIEGITLPTGANLIPSTGIAGAITAGSIACELTGNVAFIDWRGALLATVSLMALVFIERRGMNEVSRLYRVAKSRIATVAARAKRPGSGEQAGGADDVSEPGIPSDGQ